jgi:DNA-binding CsgD family transcriptional regulator
MAKQSKKGQNSSRQPRRKPVKLTRREYKLLVALRKGKTGTQAALAAGYSPKNPAESAVQARRNIEKKIGFDIYESMGLTRDDFIRKHLVPALEAKETKFFAHNGKVISKREVVNWQARLRAQDMTYQIAGEYKVEQQNFGPTFKTVIINAEHRPPRAEVSVTIPTLTESQEKS